MGGFAGGRPGTALNFKKAHGEKKDADFVAADTWTSTVLAELLCEYSPRDIYNADETGIYFRAVPDGFMGVMVVTNGHYLS